MSGKHKSAEHVAKIVSEMELAAYKRGWTEAVAAMNAAAAKMATGPATPTAPEPEAKTMSRTTATGRRRNRKRRGAARKNHRALVLQTIVTNPGRTGTQVAGLLKDVNRHTVRTQIRKLRMAGEIEQVEKDDKIHWYARGAYQRAA